MAYQVKVPAKGNGKNTGAPGASPAPIVRVVPTAPDEISMVRKPTPNGAGQNGPQPSSINPGRQLLSPMAANMKATRDDPALDAVISGQPIGGNGPSGQERHIDPTPFPTAHGMRSRSGER